MLWFFESGMLLLHIEERQSEDIRGFSWCGSSCLGCCYCGGKRKTFLLLSEGGRKKNRHRPSLPYRRRHSTIGSEGLNFSVRNGKRCDTLDIDTRKIN